MDARTIKQLTGAKTRRLGEGILFEKLSAREWLLNGRPARCAGYDHRKDLVHFTSTWSVPGGAGHCRVGISLEKAISNQDGVLSNYVVLC